MSEGQLQDIVWRRFHAMRNKLISGLLRYAYLWALCIRVFVGSARLRGQIGSQSQAVGHVYQFRLRLTKNTFFYFRFTFNICFEIKLFFWKVELLNQTPIDWSGSDSRTMPWHTRVLAWRVLDSWDHNITRRGRAPPSHIIIQMERQHTLVWWSSVYQLQLHSNAFPTPVMQLGHIVFGHADRAPEIKCCFYMFLFFCVLVKVTLASTVFIIKRLSHCCACTKSCAIDILYCHLEMLAVLPVYLMHFWITGEIVPASTQVLTLWARKKIRMEIIKYIEIVLE